MSKRFWSELTSRLEPYTPGEQPRVPGLLKLNTNESPYSASPRVIDAIRSVELQDLLRYPDPRATALREAVADFNGLSPDQVFLGNGSDEVLSHVFLGLLKHQRELLFPDISYSFYPVWCQLHEIHFRQVPLREDFSIVASDYDTNASAVILPNPNAPTGRLLPLANLREFLHQAPDRLLVVDEAYIDFGGESAVALLRDFDNLLVVQTLSKSRALAGLRVGLAMGSRELIEGLERIKDSFNSYPLGVVAQRAAVAAYEDRSWFEHCCARVIDNRESLRVALEALDFEVQPSAANFLFARHRVLPGRAIFDGLRERGVIIRRWDKPRIADHLRISIGTEEECERLLEAIRQTLATLSSSAVHS
jgi:histidinol-phosphate aminotransferase